MYISRLCDNPSYQDIIDACDEIKEVSSKRSHQTIKDLSELMSNLVYKSSLTNGDIELFNSLVDDVLARENQIQRDLEIERLQELIANSDGSYVDKEGSTRYFLSADGCYSDRKILAHYGWSVTSLRGALSSLGLSKEDYNIVYDDETCHVTLPDSLFEEISVEA